MGDHRQSGGRMGLPRKPRPPRRLRLAEQTHLAPPFELSHWGKRSSRRAHRALDGQRNSTEQSGAERPRATDRGEPTSTSVPLRISFRALVRASEGPSPLLSSPSPPLLSCRGSSLCRGRSPPPTTRTTPATRGAAAAAAGATTRHK